MKHILLLLPVIVLLQSQSFRFSLAGQYNSLITQKEESRFGSTRESSEKLSLSHFIDDAFGSLDFK